MSLLSSLLLVLLLGLGSWQVQRAQLKQHWEEAWLASMGALAIDEAQLLALAPQAPPAFTRIRLQGSYDAQRQFFLDNRTRAGRPGYQVVTPFHSDAGHLYLLQRGWVAAPADRAELPLVTTPTEPLTLVAVFWPHSGELPVLGADHWGPDWPKRVQRLDVQRLYAALQAEVPPAGWLLQLEPGQPGQLDGEHPQRDFGAARHRGYAWQWFSMALVLALAFVIWGFRRDPAAN